jgi:hypothetical protein
VTTKAKILLGCNEVHAGDNPKFRGRHVPPRAPFLNRRRYNPYDSAIRPAIYRVSHEECARLREGVPHGKEYRYNPKHLCPKLNGYGDNGQRKAWYSSGSMHYRYQLARLISVCP